MNELLCVGGSGKKYKVWTCKLVVPGNAELPRGFDWPPRKGATDAVANAGIEVVGCFSGWGGELTDTETEIVEGRNAGAAEVEAARGKVYAMEPAQEGKADADTMEAWIGSLDGAIGHFDAELEKCELHALNGQSLLEDRNNLESLRDYLIGATPQPTTQGHVIAMEPGTMPPPPIPGPRGSDGRPQFYLPATPPLPQASKEGYVPVPVDLLREVRDTVQSSTVEADISPMRREYRVDLHGRLTAALAAPPAPGVVEALQFYAEVEHYTRRYDKHGNAFSAVDDDGGSRACEALQSLEPVQPISGGGE